MATAAEIRAAILAGPQTQDALDEAMMTYTPAQMAAAFPEYGGIGNFNTAASDAQRRLETKATLARQDAMFGPGGSAQGRSLVVSPDDLANPNQQLTAAQIEAQRLTSLVNQYGGSSRLPQAEIDAAQAAAQQAVKDGRLSQSAYNFLQYRQGETDPMQQVKIGELQSQRGVNPYDQNLWAMGEEAAATAQRRADMFGETPAWNAPNAIATQAARNAAADALAAQRAREAAAGPFVAGPGGSAPSGLLTGGTPTAGTPTAGTPTAGTPTAGTPTAGTPTAGTPTGSRSTIQGLLTTPPNLPPVQQNPVSTFGSTSIPTGMASQYSRQYPEQDLKNIRDWWSKTYGNREQAMSDMTKYGITTQDLSNAIGEPYSQLASYLKAGGAQSGFGGAIEGAGGLFRRAADMAQQPGIQFGTTQGLLSDPTSQLARNILGRDTQYQQTAPTMGSGKWGMPGIAPGAGLLAPDYWLAAKTAEAQKTEAAKNPPPVEQYGSGY
jgi:hypothetical protein